MDLLGKTGQNSKQPKNHKAMALKQQDATDPTAMHGSLMIA
jgi:hypothetical protein